MQAVMISIRPCYCADIANLIKTIEIRKSRPRLETPFKCYIYCTSNGRPLVYGDVRCWEGYREEYTQTYGYSRKEAERIWDVYNGHVMGEFICDDCSLLSKEHYGYIEKHGRLSPQQLKKYMGIPEGQELEYSDGCYGWHISELEIYDTPKELCEFFKPCIKEAYPWCLDCERGLTAEERPWHIHERSVDVPCGGWLKRPPQSWCYVEGRDCRGRLGTNGHVSMVRKKGGE